MVTNVNPYLSGDDLAGDAYVSPETEAKSSIRRELGIPKSAFEAIWKQARGSELRSHYKEDFEKGEVCDEAKEAVEQRWRDYRELLEVDGHGRATRKQSLAGIIGGDPEGAHGDRDLGPMVRVGASTRLQAEAFSLLLAGLAEKLGEAASYRRTHLGGRLLGREEARSHLSASAGTKAEEDLADTAVRLGRLYAWSLEQAVLFVLCGEVPRIKPLRAVRTKEGGAVMPTRIEAMPWVSAKDVVASYRLVQRVAQGKVRHGPAKEPYPATEAEGAGGRPSQARAERQGDRPGDERAKRVRRRRRGSPDSRARAKPASDRSLEVYCFVERRRAERAAGEQPTFKELRKGYDEWVVAWNAANPEEEPKRPFGDKTDSFEHAHARGKAWLMAWLDRPLLLDPT